MMNSALMLMGFDSASGLIRKRDEQHHRKAEQGRMSVNGTKVPSSPLPCKEARLMHCPDAPTRG
jgi:hypothetical protein